VVIDPRKTKVAEMANLFLQVTPGIDVCLALTLIATSIQKNIIDKKNNISYLA
jgi:anaerobic selenocysteine-containing dehydrogenase